jgi:UDP-N-acetyl-D-galactosamine dehydrogenase
MVKLTQSIVPETIGVIGLGYVGLPLAVAFSKRFNVIGFDTNVQRISELISGYDKTKECSPAEVLDSGVVFTTDMSVIGLTKFLIVTVPTPVDKDNRPDLRPLINASKTLGKWIKPGTTIVYESTVYPGCTEEVCIPEIERESGLIWKSDFFIGYSPERINPGDKEHSIQTVKKIVAGDSQGTLQLVNQIYTKIVDAGTHQAPSIKTAEAAKVIENIQRDINIALMNELAIIFDKLGVNTNHVLEAAATKWNFQRFSPGLVGGHCIGVDPYYLTYKAESLGYNPQVILSGRKINDSMGKFIAEKTVRLLIDDNCLIKNSKVLILGWTFKENVPDVRNSKVFDIYKELQSFGINVSVYDPEADGAQTQIEYGVKLLDSVQQSCSYDAVIIAVKHQSVIEQFPVERIARMGFNRPPVVIDVKSMYQGDVYLVHGVKVWFL